MAKQVKEETITPVSVEKITFGNTFEVDIPQGKAYVIPLVEGKEDYSQAFFIGIGTAERHFEGKPNFIVKKKN